MRCRGYRFIPLVGPAIIYENLYRSYTEIRDHIEYNARKLKAVCLKGGETKGILAGIQEVGQVKMDFSQIDRSDFRTIRRNKTVEISARIDYEVQLIFDGIRLTYRLIVPELGQWWNWDGRTESQHDGHWGKHPYQTEATMQNIAAAYDVSGYRIRPGKTHADEPSSSTRANKMRVTSGQRERTQISAGQRRMPDHSPTSIIPTNRTSDRRKTPKARPRQKPCGHCCRSNQALRCDVSHRETRCTRCVRLRLTCKP